MPHVSQLGLDGDGFSAVGVDTVQGPGSRWVSKLFLYRHGKCVNISKKFVTANAIYSHFLLTKVCGWSQRIGKSVSSNVRRFDGYFIVLSVFLETDNL